jgi:hypothetical protein
VPAAPSLKTKTAPAEVTALRSRARVPIWLVALVCAGAAVAYGVFFQKMRMGPPLVMLGLGGMTLALCGRALWRVIDPLTRSDEMATALPPRAPQRLRELDREKQLVLKAIKEIELDYQMRKIAEVDYRDMIERYRGRAMRLIAELEAGDNYRQLIERELKDRVRAINSGVVPEPAPAKVAPVPSADSSPASGASCPTCATVNDNDAQFCKSCGVRLTKVKG